MKIIVGSDEIQKKTPHEVGQYFKWQWLCYWFHSIGLPLCFSDIQQQALNIK
jgi:hypothetical protein